MRLLLITFTLLCFNLQAQISHNIDLRSNWDVDTLPTASGNSFNDIWGYADCAGDEYAIIGSALYTHFFNVTDPDNIVETSVLPNTAPSLWRDFKTYKNRAYGVADQGNEGLSIFDLSMLPDSVVRTNMTNAYFGRSHNIFIDEDSGWLYVVGSNTRNDGILIFDLNTNPDNPDLIADVSLSAGGGYVHDVYVRDNIAYCSHGNNGYYIWDFNDPTNPTIIASVPTNGYNHSSWLTEDGRYAIIAEEVPRGLPLLVIDLTDMMNNNINIVHSFLEPLLAPAFIDNTPHNPFIRGNHLVVSYYEDGTQIFDISDPLNPVRIGYYDTAPLNTSYSGTRNNWGTYPYLPSGNIISSDTENGLFVMTPDSFALAPIIPNNMPDATIVSPTTPSITICENDTTYLEVQAGADYYTWLNNVDTLPETSNILEITTGGNYRAIAHLNGCEAISSNIAVFITSPPNATITPSNNTTFCQGDSVILFVAPGADQYIWTKDGALLTDSINFIIANESGLYAVDVFENNCETTSPQSIMVTVFQPIIPVITIEEDSLFTTLVHDNYQWYFENVPLFGATDSFFIVSQTGNYSMETTDSLGCTAVSNTVFYEAPIMSSIPEIQYLQHFSTYPNPATNFIQIDLQTSEKTNLNISLVNLLGQTIQQEKHQCLGKTTLDWNISNFETGIYFLRLDDGTNSVVRKIIIR